MVQTHFPTLHDSPFHVVHSHGSDEGSLKLNELTSLVTKLFERIGVLEDDLVDDKENYHNVEDDLPYKGGKIIDAEVQEKASTETEPIIQEVTLTEVIQDQESSEKGWANVSIAGATQRVLLSEVQWLSFAEAIRLEEQMNEEQRAQIARDEEIARQWDEEERQRAMSESKASKKEDRWMISVLKDFKGMSYNEIRPIFEKVWDFNHHIEPKEHGSEKMKSPEKIEEKDVDEQKEMKEVVKESGEKRKKSLPRKRSTVKRQKMEIDDEKEDLKVYLDIVPKTGDGSSKNYKVLSEMLEDFDRQDVEELYRLVKESWSLYDFCGIHILLMQNGIAIHILTEKKYPLSQEMITKMLNKRLEVDHESTQAYELLKFIRSPSANVEECCK
ncbi:hypothetical protein Tco_0417665 [Tanacetum coccineum]